MAKHPHRQGAGDGEPQFFTNEGAGYQRSADAGPGAGTVPRPQMPPMRTAAPPQQAAPAPPRPQAPAKPMDMSSPKDVSKALAETVVTAFVDRMKNEAEAKGGHLTINDIDAMQEEFDRQTKALRGMFEKSFEVYVKARERSVWDQHRNYPFDRLMVKKFSHLFRDGDELGPDDISRRILPGFFVAIGMMLGPDVVEEYQEKIRRVVDRVKASGKSVFDWEDVYEDNEARAVSLDAEIAIAEHFKDLHKRADWFINLVNGHLSPVEGRTAPETAGWELNEAGFGKFLNALMTDLRQVLATDIGKLQVTKRYGADTCADLFDILEQIKQ
jgi:hypothetical protein